MQNPKIRLMCVTGVFTALIYVLTAYLHVPSHMGYVHVGDGLIFLAACMLPTPYAMFAGEAGAALADCLTGFAREAYAFLYTQLCVLEGRKALRARVFRKHMTRIFRNG